eukprot:COSAG06_NODE_95_length_24425_cov_882.571035_17_plen_158_part_00
MQVELDADGFAESYTVEGCSNPAHCGVFRRVDAHCGSGYRCPGGARANGNSDETKCDGAPVYQRVGEGGGVDGGGPVLYRVYNGGYTFWRVGPSDALATCVYGGSDYLSLGSNQGPTGGAPTAPEYSAGDGSYDYDNNARGTISVTAGGGGGGGGGH